MPAQNISAKTRPVYCLQYAVCLPVDNFLLPMLFACIKAWPPSRSNQSASASRLSRTLNSPLALSSLLPPLAAFVGIIWHSNAML